MRIGIDARTSAGETGVAQYGNNLISALKLIDHGDEFVIFNKEKDPIPFWTAHVAQRSVFGKAKIDLLHILAGTTPLGYRHPYVLTVHDLAIYKHPEWFPEGQWFSTAVSYPSTVKHALHIIAPSEATKRDLVELMKVDEKKITVIPHGVDPSPYPPPDRVGGNTRYILFLDTIEPRKNVTTLVRAYRRMIDEHRELADVELRIAGAVGWRADEIMDEIRKTQCEGYKIVIIGRVSEEEKWRSLGEASCFAFPSHYEGFGLPVLEAMAAGAPVVCSDASSLPEVAGNAALLNDPNDIDGFAAKIARILLDQKTADELRAKGLARAAEFSWERTAERTLEVYRKFNA